LQGAGRAKPRAELDARLLLDASHLGRGYGFATEAGEAATRIAAGYGLQLEQTYTAKTFARALELVAHPERSGPLPAGRPLRVLYWHTSAATPLDDLLRAAPSAEQLPAPILRLLR
jgi:1-aminocyclopropane-1-carboxylate deaminase/D-cysteine desulfhydrase-like pyridoxal-dependent ACC family enzyme